LLIGTGSPYHSIIWDLETFKILRLLTASGSSDVFVDKNGNAKLMTLESGSLSIWNIDTGEKEYSFGKNICCITFKVFDGQNGKKKVVTGEVIPIIWDIDTGNCDFVFNSFPKLPYHIHDIDIFKKKNKHTQIVFHNPKSHELIISDYRMTSI
jgi:hypothetical protein